MKQIKNDKMTTQDIKNTLNNNYESFESSMNNEEFTQNVNDFVETIEDSGDESVYENMKEDELLKDFSLFVQNN